MFGIANAVAAAKQSMVGPQVHILRVGPMTALRTNPAIQNNAEAAVMVYEWKITSRLCRITQQEWF